MSLNRLSNVVHIGARACLSEAVGVDLMFFQKFANLVELKGLPYTGLTRESNFMHAESLSGR